MAHQNCSAMTDITMAGGSPAPNLGGDHRATRVSADRIELHASLLPRVSCGSAETEARTYEQSVGRLLLSPPSPLCPPTNVHKAFFPSAVSILVLSSVHLQLLGDQ